MGVPQLFAWLSERYPKIVARAVEEKPRVVNGAEIKPDASKPNPAGVEVDNLYLDMNGIIHPCCHPEDREQPETELDMFKAIFAYIDRIFSIVRPRRLIYLAVDGPAPRAKMNQQRSRRFRAAKEGRESKEAVRFRRDLLEKRGKSVLPPGAPGFDSNTITPGTDFMARLSRALEWYILDRLDSDPGWEKIVVLFSDATIPGEGEHKIMDYIREQRKCPDHNPNLRHVLYGADADLIMLGLVSHEPNFTILREEFQRPAKKPCSLCGKRGCRPARCPGINPEADAASLGWQPIRRDNGVRFIFILLPILREYLARELLPPGAHLTPKLREVLERRIDDWVFLCFFVGNDFLPHLPSLRIREGAIPKLVRLYMGLPGATEVGGGYLHQNGHIDMGRLEMLMQAVGKVEDKIFVARHEGQVAKAGENKKRRLQDLKGKLTAQQQYTLAHGPEIEEASFWMTALSRTDLDEKERERLSSAPAPLEIQAKEVSEEAQQWLDRKRKRQAARAEAKETDHDSGPAVLPPPLSAFAAGQAAEDPEQDGHSGTDDEGETGDNIKFWQQGWKERYYLYKFQTSAADEPFRSKLANEYVRGLCFVLLYYYQGVPSWRWYYPYHYAPFASDCGNLRDVNTDFSDGGDPFSPLQQLMAVFPPDSAHLLPEPLAEAMTNRSSEIADFYPLDFETDRNGFKYDWQGVALLPFVDEARLNLVYEERVKRLSRKRRAKNTFGCDRIFARVQGDLRALGDHILETISCTPVEVGNLIALRTAAGRNASVTAKLKAAIRSLCWGTLDSAKLNGVSGHVRLDFVGSPSEVFLFGSSFKAKGLPRVTPSVACAYYRNPAHLLSVEHTVKELAGTSWPPPRLGRRDRDKGKHSRGAKFAVSGAPEIADKVVPLQKRVKPKEYLTQPAKNKTKWRSSGNLPFASSKR